VSVTQQRSRRGRSGSGGEARFFPLLTSQGGACLVPTPSAWWCPPLAQASSTLDDAGLAFFFLPRSSHPCLQTYLGNRQANPVLLPSSSLSPRAGPCAKCVCVLWAVLEREDQ